MKGKKSIGGDISGGINAAIVSIPKNIAYGAIVFAPLGPGFLPFAVLSGFIAFIVMNLITALFYGNRILSSGPASLVSVMLASALSMIITGLNRLGQMNVHNALMFFFLLAVMISLTLLLFAFLKAGELAKYIPYPVVAGITNGGALLIILSRVKPFLGMGSAGREGEIAGWLPWLRASVNPALFGFGLMICLFFIVLRRLSRGIPASLFGILFGTLAFHALPPIFPGIFLGPTIGSVPVPFAEIGRLIRFDAFLNPQIYFRHPDLCAALIAPAVGTAVIITLNSLIVQSTADGLLGSRSRSSRELAAQGVGNLITTLFGGFPGNPGLSRTIENYKAGARGPASKLFSALFSLIIIVLLKETLPYIPEAAFTALIIMLAFMRFDLKIFAGLQGMERFTFRDERVIDAAVSLLVVLVMLAYGITEAVGIGVLISFVMFVLRSGRNVIRREFNGTMITSNVERSGKELQVLREHGRHIHIIEMEGALFFGSADLIARRVGELEEQGILYVLLDFRYINDVDLSAVRILEQIRRRNGSTATTVLLSSIRKGSRIRIELGMEENVFESLEDAFAWAENLLIRRHIGVEDLERELALRELEYLERFTPEDFVVLEQHLERRVYRSGQIVFHEKDPGDAVYLITRGHAHVYITRRDDRIHRLSSISKGAVFGEMALLDGKRRSAGIVSAGRLVCYRLAKSALEEMTRTHPETAMKFVLAIGGELSKRLRIVNSLNTALRQ